MKNEIKQKAEYCLNCKTKPCTKGCPLSNNIQDLIHEIKEENYKEAYNILSKTTVLSGICGRICPHMSQCEGSCIRGIKQNPVSIGELESFIGDIASKKDYPLFEDIKEQNGKTVAVVGSGPASLTCAAFLAKDGFKVTIFEKREKLGGILRYGIPKFRLEEKVLDNTINRIVDLGIDVNLGKELGQDYSLEDLQNKFDAVFLGIGANVSNKMNIEGEEIKGVYGGNELLEYKEYPNFIGKKIAVIGGGNVAIDSAREINRLGAEKVTIIYRRAEKQMPAEEKEVKAAKSENINFLFQTNLIKVIGNENVEKIECIKTKLVKKEGETREVPVNIQGSNFEMDMDYVIMAIGSKTERKIVDSLGVEVNKWGFIKVDNNYMTSKTRVFAGGDLVGEKQTVAWASKSGREAAKAIIEYLK